MKDRDLTASPAAGAYELRNAARAQASREARNIRKAGWKYNAYSHLWSFQGGPGVPKEWILASFPELGQPPAEGRNK